MTLSTPIRIVALVGLLAALGMGAFVMLGLSDKSSSTPVVVNPAPNTHHARPHARTAHARTAAATRQPTLPAPVVHALAKHPVVVAVVYANGLADEALLVSEARKGASSSRAGFEILDVRKEKVARAVATMFPGASDPAVLIVTRKHGVVTMLEGVQEAGTVSQAVANAR